MLVPAAKSGCVRIAITKSECAGRELTLTHSACAARRGVAVHSDNALAFPRVFYLIMSATKSELAGHSTWGAACLMLPTW